MGADEGSRMENYAPKEEWPLHRNGVSSSGTRGKMKAEYGVPSIGPRGVVLGYDGGEL